MDSLISHKIGIYLQYIYIYVYIYSIYIYILYTHTYTYTYVLTSSLSLAKFCAGNGPISLRTALFGGEPDRLHAAWPAGICAQEMLVVFGIMGISPGIFTKVAVENGYMCV